ncbi:MAG: hypothetical protein ACXVB5_20750, partial [Isosphaeraceae bacterium]
MEKTAERYLRGSRRRKSAFCYVPSPVARHGAQPMPNVKQASDGGCELDFVQFLSLRTDPNGHELEDDGSRRGQNRREVTDQVAFTGDHPDTGVHREPD